MKCVEKRIILTKQTLENIMNKDIIKGRWQEVKGKVKEQWGKFTDDDLTQIEGNFEVLQGKLQKYYGYSTEQAKEQMERFIAKNKLQEPSRIQGSSRRDMPLGTVPHLHKGQQKESGRKSA